MIRAILVDDEPLARTRLRRLLQDFHHRVAIVGEASNGEEGLALIESLHPDLIFLDIEMPIKTGFEMIRELHREIAIIFVTAYDQFAIKAFEENAIDYLLKPVDPQRLARSINKAEQQLLASFGALQQLLKIVQSERKVPVITSLTIKLNDRILILKLDDIIYLKAEDKYVSIHTKNENTYISDYTLNYLKDTLPANFIRIHRSLILNRNYLKELRKGFNGSFTFLMGDEKGIKLKSSRGYLEEIRIAFSL